MQLLALYGAVRRPQQAGEAEPLGSVARLPPGRRAATASVSRPTAAFTLHPVGPAAAASSRTAHPAGLTPPAGRGRRDIGG